MREPHGARQRGRLGRAARRLAAVVVVACFIAAPGPAAALQAAGAVVEPPALLLPVQGKLASELSDTFADTRDARQRGHEAIDILAPRGTPVLAVDDGRIVKLFLSKPGGITLYHFDPTGQFAYYYAHLDRYADGVAEGQTVRRGAVIGYVGATGNASADAPHLHFAIFRLGPEKQWWKGEPINPFGYLGGRKP
ncbi:MAG: peptidase [Polaromonas sp.]|nr:peptidase [Polaromonas sp.]